ncbi:MAG: O-antigen ligase family protein [Bacteroidota bacterium]
MDRGRTSAFARLRDVTLLALLVIGVHCVAVGKLYDPELHSKYTFLAAYLLLISLFSFFAPSTTENRNHPLFWGALALPVWLSASLFWARTPMEGLPEVMRWWEAFLIFALLPEVFRDRERFHRILSRAACIFVLLVTLIGSAELAYAVHQAGNFSHSVTYQVLVFFAHRNLLSHALALAMPLVLLAFLREKKGWWWVSALALLPGSGLLVLLLVRSTWLAMAIGGLVFLIGFFPVVQWLERPLRRRVVRRSALLVALAVGAGIGGTQYLRGRTSETDLLRKHAQMISHTGYGSPGERALFWRRTLELWQERPLLGHGAGQWKIEAPGRSLGGVRKTISRGEVFVVRAHNDPLQLLAEAGPLALVAWLLVLFLALRIAWRQIRVGEPQAALRALCYAPGLVIFGVIACFSFPMERPSSYVWWGIYLAAIWMNRPASFTLGRPAKISALRGLSTGMSLLLLILGLVWIQKDQAWLAAMAEGSAGRPQRVVEQLDEDLRIWMPLDPATTPLSWYRGMAHLELQDTAAALADFTAAHAVHPHHPQVMNNLATLRNHAGEPDRARALLQRAIFIAPEMDDTRLNLAALEYNEGQITTAYRVIRTLPDSSNHPNFPAFRRIILLDYLKFLVHKHAGEAVETMLGAMLAEESWALSTHEKSLDNQISFEHQALIDAIFVLHNVRNLITSSEVDSLYNHYQLDSIN